MKNNNIRPSDPKGSDLYQPGDTPSLSDIGPGFVLEFMYQGKRGCWELSSVERDNYTFISMQRGCTDQITVKPFQIEILPLEY